MSSGEKERECIIGIDAGGTKVSGLILADGKAADTFRLDTDVSSEKAVVDTIFSCFEELARRASGLGLEIAALGIGMAGYLDSRNGVVTESPNLPLRNLPLSNILTERLGLPVVLDNDSNTAALAENRLGEGKGCLHQVHLTLGTGIGGGLIIDGRLYRGASGTASEMGRMIILEDGLITDLGYPTGCLEALASGTAVEREACERFSGGWRPDAGVSWDLDSLDARIASLSAARGDSVALEIWKEVGRHLGTGIACLVNIFNPEVVTLSGGLLNAWDFFQASMFRALEDNAIPISFRSVKVLRTSLGDKGGALGAALLALDALET